MKNLILASALTLGLAPIANAFDCDADARKLAYAIATTNLSANLVDGGHLEFSTVTSKKGVVEVLISYAQKEEIGSTISLSKSEPQYLYSFKFGTAGTYQGKPICVLEKASLVESFVQ